MIYKNNNQENVKPTPTPTATPSSDNLDINDPLVQQLYNSLTIDYEHGCYMKPSDLNNNNSIRLRMAYSNLPDGTEKDTTCKEYDTKIKTNLSEYDYEYFCGPFAGDSSILGLSEEELKNEKTSYIEESALNQHRLWRILWLREPRGNHPSFRRRIRDRLFSLWLYLWL